MEAAEALKQSEGLKLNGDPGRFLRSANYLDPQDPIDELVIGYKEELDKEGFGEHNLPTAAQQRRMAAGVKNNDFQITADLAYGHMGLIAAVAYPFKNCGVDSTELLQEGRKALIRAAKTFDEQGKTDFNDHAVTTIHSTFSDILPDIAGDSFAEFNEEHPILGVYQFLETVKTADSPVMLAKMEEQVEQRTNRAVTPREMIALPLLHLPDEEVASIMGVSASRIQNITASLKRKLADPHVNSEDLALVALDRGVKFDILEVPPKEEFSLWERQVAMRLAKQNADIAEEFGVKVWRVEKAIASLNRKTEARSRVELVLMAHIDGFEPTEEELNPPPDPLEGLTAHERKVIPLIVRFENKEIADRLDGFSANSVGHAIHSISGKVGVANRTALVLELHRRGVEFDAAEPEEPISEILTPDEIKIAKLLHIPSNQEIAKTVGLAKGRVDFFIKNSKRKLDAHTRQELALLVEMFYEEPPTTNERFDPYRWKLARRLGSVALREQEIDELLLSATARQRKVIRAYYLAGKRTTWMAVSRKLGMTKESAENAAMRGIRKIRLEHGLD